MNKDFEKELIDIAKSYKKYPEHKSDNVEIDFADDLYLQALDHLFSISTEAVNIFNLNSKSDVLSTYKLPKEFLEMFLEIPGRRGGFCIISPDKIVIFFDEEPKTITVIGKNRNKEGGSSQNSAKISQLLKARFSNKDDSFQYVDNTGGAIDPYDIIALLIKWIMVRR